VKDNLLPRIRGREEMHDLVKSTVVALEQAELHELVETLRDRVLARPVEQLVEATTQGDVQEWHFKPMVELVLRHVHDLAVNQALPIEHRQGEVLATLDLGGF
jgi:hypothetical protein